MQTAAHGISPARFLRPEGLCAHPRHDDLRRPRQLRRRRLDRRRGRDPADRPLPRPRRQLHRHRRRVLGRGVRGDRRRGAEGAPRPRAARHQGAHADGRRAERRRALSPPPDRRVRGEPAAARHRPHRPLPGARVGRPDAARGDDGGARHARARRQGPLRRRLELRRPAADEGARRGRPARLPALRHAADLLLAPVARRGVRARADRDRRGHRDHRLEPARGRPDVGQVPARRRSPGRVAPAHDWDEPPVRNQEQLYDVVEALVEIGEGHGVSAAQVALAWTARAPRHRVADRRRADGRATCRQSRRQSS